MKEGRAISLLLAGLCLAAAGSAKEVVRLEQFDNRSHPQVAYWFLMPYRLKYGPCPGYKYVKKGENISYGVGALVFAGIAYRRLLAAGKITE